jgi:L-threonylcarbamoyladenylate synthase
VKNKIIEAARVINDGGVVAFPTETVYGLGADAFNPKAVARIFEIKERPAFDPLIVHISKLEDLDLLCTGINSIVPLLAERFWPGPLTLVLPKKESVPDIVTSGLSTVAVRMPDHPVASELINFSKTLVAAPSANKFGMLSPTEALHVKRHLKGIDFIIDSGKTTIGLESTVIAINKDGFVLLRPGAITSDEIEKIVPRSRSTTTNENKTQSPGLLKSHYSPAKPIYIKGETKPGIDTREAGLISFRGSGKEEQFKQHEVLSPDGDLKQAAVNLFSAMHKLEESDVKFIVAEPVPEKGIGIAIMDRLRKAAYRYKSQKTYGTFIQK